MPVDKKTAKALCSAFRTAGLSFPPESPEVVVVTLEKRARSQDHAQLIVDAWMERSREWPKPADIAQLAAEIDDPGNLAARARRDCPHCHGDGFVSVDQPYGLTAAIRCDHSGSFPGNLGVRLTPELEARYRRDTLQGGERAEEWAKNGANPMNKPEPERKPAQAPRRVTAADFDAVVEL